MTERRIANMEQKPWTVDIDGGEHTVVLNWTYYGGRREVVVDGRAVSKNTIPMRWRSEQAFEIDRQPAVVRTQPARRISRFRDIAEAVHGAGAALFVITLEVDGKAVQPDSGKSRWEA